MKRWLKVHCSVFFEMLQAVVFLRLVLTHGRVHLGVETSEEVHADFGECQCWSFFQVFLHFSKPIQADFK